MVSGDHNIRSFAGCVSDLLDVDCSCDIQAAMADEDSHTFHA
jgi:hypothetical protein